MLWKIYSRESDGGSEFARECFQNGVIALGWSALGDLNTIKSWDELWKKVEKRWRYEAEGGAKSIAQWVGAIWSFRTDVGKGHYVICPDKHSKQYYVGVIRSSRAYYDSTPLGMCEFAHRRDVKWLRSLSERQIKAIWPAGQFGGLMTVSRVHHGADRFFKFLRRKRREFAQGPHLPRQPDMEWGKEAEARAMEWLATRYDNPVDESTYNFGWDIRCGDDVFEVKGRKSDRTAVVLTENEWRAAKRLKRRYTVLIFTAANKADLKFAEPSELCDPANNPESWIEKQRTIYEYVLQE
jgi:hypothetical protein